MTQPTPRRRRRSVLVAGLLGTTALAVTTAMSLGGFSAGITNTNNTYSSGTIVLKEGVVGSPTTCFSTGTGTTITATNTANCTTIDDLGGAINQGPGSAATTQNLTLTNAGSIDGATFTVTPGACTAAIGGGTYAGTDTAGFCGKVDVTVYNSTANKCLYPAGAGACPALAATSTLTGLGTSGALSLGSLAAGATTGVTIKTQMDTTATNIDQGLTASMPFTWTLNQ
jgi:hypothetical protein